MKEMKFYTQEEIEDELIGKEVLRSVTGMRNS